MTGSDEPKAKRTTAEDKRLVLQSCYDTLIRLGDLSRYRETELNNKRRNWGPAIGYYSLAARICPDSGVAYHQQAVVALADGNHLRVIYQLYRSLSVSEPHPLAEKNLEIEFKKVLTAWDKGDLMSNNSSRDGSGASKTLVSPFIRLHSRCYKGCEFDDHEALEEELLHQLAVELKERSLEGKLQMFITINLAAEYRAASKLRGNSSLNTRGCTETHSLS